MHYDWSLRGSQKGGPERKEQLTTDASIRLQSLKPSEEGWVRFEGRVESVEHSVASARTPRLEVDDRATVQISNTGKPVGLKAKRAGELFMAPLFLQLPAEARTSWQSDMHLFVPGLDPDWKIPTTYTSVANETRLAQQCERIRFQGSANFRAQGVDYRCTLEGEGVFGVETGEPMMTSATIHCAGQGSDGTTSELKVKLSSELQPAGSILDSGGFMVRG